MLSVYMRPCVLHTEDANESNPVLSKLSLCSAAPSEPQGPAEVSPEQLTGEEDSAPPAHSAAPPKRRRLAHKSPVDSSASRASVNSYCTSWRRYIDGHVVSQTSRKFIINLLAATAARVVEDPDASSEDAEEEDWDTRTRRAGSRALIHHTLYGIAKRSPDDGEEGIGKHTKTVHLGRSLWQTPDLSAAEEAPVRERFFEDDTFPAAQEALQAAAQKIKEDDERPKPYAACTEPCAAWRRLNYERLLRD